MCLKELKLMTHSLKIFLILETRFEQNNQNIHCKTRTGRFLKKKKKKKKKNQIILT